MNRVVSADDMAPQILVEPQPAGEVVLVGSPPSRVVCAQPAGALVDQAQPDAVVVDVRPPTLLVTEQKLEQVVLAGVRGRPGDSAFEEWLLRNPGGTWDDFMSELGSGATWNNVEW